MNDWREIFFIIVFLSMSVLTDFQVISIFTVQFYPMSGALFKDYAN